MTGITITTVDEINRSRQDAQILTLCEKYGFGAVMESASRQWQARDPVGAITLGECVGMKTLVSKGELEAAQEVFEKWFCEDLGLDMSTKESGAILTKMILAVKKVT